MSSLRDSAGTMPLVQDTTQVDTLRGGKVVERRAPRRSPEPGAESDTLVADSLGAALEPFPNPDSIMQDLLQRPGFRPVVYRGDTLRFSTQDRSIHIRQRANVDRAGDKLQSDSVVYKGQYIIGFGNSTLVNADGKEVTSEEGPLYYNTERKIGTIMDARTEWEVWHVAGNFTLEGSDTLWVRGGHFTSCELPEPHYRFESDKIKLIMGHIVIAWPVRVYMGDVPVFWFPFIAQDIRRGRHSGILTFRFGFNDIVRNSSGYNRHISNLGYYWAINDYMDAQFSMDWWSGNWTRFDTFFRYRWRKQFLDGRIGYSHFLLPNGGREISAAWNHSQKFGERSDLRASVQYVSSRQFERQAEFNPERLTQQIRSNVGFTRRFDWGALNVSGQRIQPLSFGQATTTTVPQVSLTLSPIAITPASSPLEARWYNGLTWTGSTNFTRTLVESPPIVDSLAVVVDSLAGTPDSIRIVVDTTSIPDRVTMNAGLSSDFALNKLRWNSSASLNQNTVGAPDGVFTRPDALGGDSILVFGPRISETSVSWRSSLGYQQRLVGTTSITPALSLDGQLFRSAQTFNQFVSAPTRVSASATLNAEVYGFFPGFGPYERVRHKFTPSLNWLFSPEVKPNPELEGLPIGVGASAERHQLSLGLSQTIEAKLKPRSNLDEEAEGDSAQAQQPAEARKLTLLAIRTTALTYDLVTGRLVTGTISNTLTSDLLRGLTVRLQHELFDQRPSGRAFDPFLTQLNLSFSLGQAQFEDLFGGGGGIGRTPGIVPETQSLEEIERQEELMRAEEEERRDGDEDDGRRPWTLSIDYSLLKRRAVPGSSVPNNRQSVRFNLGFSPTQHWTMTWRTQYDIENGSFVDQALTLRRDLHRWAATFAFLRASNGNFVFNFEVSLNDLSDVRIPYRQESR